MNRAVNRVLSQVPGPADLIADRTPAWPGSSAVRRRCIWVVRLARRRARLGQRLSPVRHHPAFSRQLRRLRLRCKLRSSSTDEKSVEMRAQYVRCAPVLTTRWTEAPPFQAAGNGEAEGIAAKDTRVIVDGAAQGLLPYMPDLAA